MTRIYDHVTPALLISHEVTRKFFSDDREFLQVQLRPVYLTHANEVRNYLDDHGDQPLADLVITALADRDMPEVGYFGHDFEYRGPYAVDLPRAEAMVKLLRRVDRGLTRLSDEFGHPESFGAYAARIASVLSIRTFGWRNDNANRGAYADSEFHWSNEPSVIAGRLTQVLDGYLHERLAA